MTVIARPSDSHPENRQRKEYDPCGEPFQETANNNGVARTSIGKTSADNPLIPVARDGRKARRRAFSSPLIQFSSPSVRIAS